MRSGSENGPGFEADPLSRLEPDVRLTVDERLTLVRDAVERYGEGFLAWVIRFPELTTEPTMTEEFRRTYFGWYPDRQSFMNDQLDHLDWPAELADRLAALGMPSDCVHIQPEGFWQHCEATFGIEERLGGVHVFAR